jgi:crossover junction endodeoxyribonuclease RusA
MIVFTYDGDICPLNAKTNIGGMMFGNQRGRGINVNTGRYINSKEAIGWAAKEQSRGIYFKEEFLFMTISMFYKSHEPDIDAYCKIILDALIGVCYEDDKQIRKLNIEKFKSKYKKVVIVIGKL